MSELAEFYKSVPSVTRILTLSSLVIGGLNALNLISSVEFICYFPDVWYKFEIYRLLTGFVVPNPQAMQGMMEIYMVYRFSRGIEEGKFNKKLSNYIYYLLIIIPIILIISLICLNFNKISYYSLQPALLSALTFTWSVKNYNQQVNFYFMPIQASLLPAVSLGFRLLVDGIESFKVALLGMASAYVYNCLETKSYGPLFSFITGREPQKNNNSHRLGSLPNANTTAAWFYSTGDLDAPDWLKVVLGETDSRRSVFGSGANTGSHAGSGTSTGTATGTTAGFGARNRDTGGKFCGEGRRLGSERTKSE